MRSLPAVWRKTNYFCHFSLFSLVLSFMSARNILREPFNFVLEKGLTSSVCMEIAGSIWWAPGTTQMCEVLRFVISRSHVLNTKRTHTHKKRIYANQFHHHCSFSFLLISFQEIWKVDWAEIEAREERDSDLPWVIEASILFTVAKIDNDAKC